MEVEKASCWRSAQMRHWFRSNSVDAFQQVCRRWRARCCWWWGWWWWYCNRSRFCFHKTHLETIRIRIKFSIHCSHNSTSKYARRVTAYCLLWTQWHRSWLSLWPETLGPVVCMLFVEKRPTASTAHKPMSHCRTRSKSGPYAVDSKCYYSNQFPSPSHLISMHCAASAMRAYPPRQ